MRSRELAVHRKIPLGALVASLASHALRRYSSASDFEKYALQFANDIFVGGCR